MRSHSRTNCFRPQSVKQAPDKCTDFSCLTNVSSRASERPQCVHHRGPVGAGDVLDWFSCLASAFKINEGQNIRTTSPRWGQRETEKDAAVNLGSGAMLTEGRLARKQGGSRDGGESKNLPPACFSLMASSQRHRARLHYLSPSICTSSLPHPSILSAEEPAS